MARSGWVSPSSGRRIGPPLGALLVVALVLLGVPGGALPTRNPHPSGARVEGRGGPPALAVPPALPPKLTAVAADGPSSTRGAAGNGSGAHYNVTFVPAGLPAGAEWSVILSGLLGTARGSISFQEPNGTYSYTVLPYPQYTTSKLTGKLRVSGFDVTELITFVPTTFPVVFEQTSLAAGTTWSVAVNGSIVSSRGVTLTVNLPRGTFAYAVLPIDGWRPSPSHGKVTVAGVAVTIGIVWTELTYAVQFNQSGLKTGTPWSLQFDGVTYSTSNGSITLLSPNGSFPYEVTPPGGYLASPASGWVHVNGTALHTIIDFAHVQSPLTTILADAPYLVGGAVLLVVVVLLGAFLRRRRPPPPSTPPAGPTLRKRSPGPGRAAAPKRTPPASPPPELISRIRDSVARVGELPNDHPAKAVALKIVRHALSEIEAGRFDAASQQLDRIDTALRRSPADPSEIPDRLPSGTPGP